MPNVEQNKLLERIKQLKEEIEGLYATRKFYGESGFAGTKITDDLLSKAKSKTAIVRELENLLKDEEE